MFTHKEAFRTKIPALRPTANEHIPPVDTHSAY